MNLSGETTSADLSEIVIPIGETEDSGITLAELLDFADIHLGSNGDTSVRTVVTWPRPLGELREYMPEYADWTSIRCA